MKANISLIARSIKLDIQRSVMCRKRQPRRRKVGLANLIRQGAVLGLRKLVADLETVVLRNLRGIPDGVAVRIAKVVSGCRAVQEAKKVELLAWVVLVDIFPVARDAVNAVLNAKNPARDRVLPNTDRVAQAPSQHSAFGVERVRLVGRRHPTNVKHADLRQSIGQHRGLVLVCLATATGHHQLSLLLSRDEECSCNEIVVAHASDNDAGGRADSALFRIILPRVDGIDGRGVQSATILGQSKAMVQLPPQDVNNCFPERHSSKDLPKSGQ